MCVCMCSLPLTLRLPTPHKFSESSKQLCSQLRTALEHRRKWTTQTDCAPARRGDKIDAHSDSMTVPLQLLLLLPLLSLLSWFCASLLRHVVQPQNDSDGQLVAAAAADSVSSVRGWWSLWLLLSSIKVIVGKKRGRQASRQEECTAECRRIIN